MGYANILWLSPSNLLRSTNDSTPSEDANATPPAKIAGENGSEVVNTLNFDLQEKRIRLEVKGEQLNVEADEQLLRQALFNLLLNAVRPSMATAKSRWPRIGR